MKLVSLELTKKEAKELNSPPSNTSDLPKYPYGTRISLNYDMIERFPDIRDMPVGTKLKIECEAELVEYSERQVQNGEDHCSAEIQITEMAIEEDAEQRKERKRASHLNEIGGSKNETY